MHQSDGGDLNNGTAPRQLPERPKKGGFYTGGLGDTDATEFLGKCKVTVSEKIWPRDHVRWPITVLTDANKPDVTVSIILRRAPPQPRRWDA